MNNPITTPELYRLLSLCIGKEKPASAYAVAKALGCTQTAAKNWQLGARVMDESHAVQVAELLGLDLAFVVLSLQAERANKSNMAKIAAIFSRAAVASLGHAALVVLSVFIGFSALSASPAQAGEPASFSREVCILCKTFTRLFRKWARTVHRHFHGHGWPRHPSPLYILSFY